MFQGTVLSILLHSCPKSDACLDFSVRLTRKRSSLEKSLPEEKPGAELGWGGQGWVPADPVVRDLLGAGEGGGAHRPSGQEFLR